MFIILAELYHRQEFLDSIRRSPNMKWKAGIPKRFEGSTKVQVKQLLQNNLRPNISLPAVKLIGNTPKVFSWSLEKPECSGQNTIRDQRQCISGWAFSAINQLSDNRCINGLDKERVQYSEQYVVSCDPTNLGCQGGWLDTVQSYLIDTGAVLDTCCTYQSGFTEKDGICPKQCKDLSDLKFTKASKSENICTDEESIKVALTIGTVQTAFYVYEDFMYYESGIYEHVQGYQEGGQAALFVGYGEENGIPYWTVKNSWGLTFGENGFFRIIRGQNECKIENECFLLTP